jgi:dihydroflavonol-4-reductase
VSDKTLRGIWEGAGLTERVVVTGATGCLGSNLAAALIESTGRVVVFKRHGDALGALAPLRNHFEIRFGDIRDPEATRRALRGATKVYHLAGIAIPLDSYEREMWEVNVVGTHNVLSAAVQEKVERVVHVSSTAAIGYPMDHDVADETFDFADSVEMNPYSITKRRGEQIALSFNSDVLQVVVTNPAAVLAPGGSMRYGWGALMAASASGRIVVCPPGGSAFCTRRDLVEGLTRAMAEGRAGERYILSSGNLSYQVLTCLMARAAGVAQPRMVGPDWAFRLFGRVNDFAAAVQRDPQRSPILVSANTRMMCRTLFYDQSKAIRDLGVSQTSISDAIAELHAWHEANREHAVVAAPANGDVMQVQLRTSAGARVHR